MSDSSHIESDAFVELSRLLDDERVRSLDLRQERSHGVRRVLSSVRSNSGESIGEIKISFCSSSMFIIPLESFISVTYFS